MDDPYATGGATTAVPQPPPSLQTWYDHPQHHQHQQHNQQPNTTGSHSHYQQQQHSSSEDQLRSVTPAMKNTRGSFRAGSPLAGQHSGNAGAAQYPSSPGQPSRAGTPSRYLGAYNSPEATDPNNAMAATPSSSDQHNNNNHSSRPEPPSSTGLIRLTLRKPMGIVFEPMYDPNNPSLQRGVRICDLPRTGAAALSRKLEVGDELLSINDKTMSRLSFDEIMDFIIEADPEEVNLLFRRPRKETLQARSGMKKPLSASAGGAGAADHQPAVKWVDDDVRNSSSKKSSKKKDRKGESSSKKHSSSSSSRRKIKTADEEDTITSQDEDYRRSSRSSKKGRSSSGRKHPYESESFLDLLIDTICANPDHACRERRRGDDDYFSDEDEDGTFASQDDESTYVTYESEDVGKRRSSSKSKSKRGGGEDEDSSSVDEETEEDTVEEKWKRKHKKDKESGRSSSSGNKSPLKDKHNSSSGRGGGAAGKSPDKANKTNDKYEDDGTLETVDSQDRVKPVVSDQPPLGLQPGPVDPEPVSMMPPPALDDDANPAPIRELEYDDRIDHGADVSVMESLGGPSLLIEKQRMAMAAKAQGPSASGPTVPAEFIEKFGKDYPVTFGFTHEQTIQADPLKFYTFVVKGLLEEHEPEKVRLLDKLLAKYKGREDHLVQKLSVRYSKNEQDPTHSIPEEDEEHHHHHHPQGFDDDHEQQHHHHSHHHPVEPATPKESPNAAAGANQHNTATTPIMQPSEAQFTPDDWPEKETKEGEEDNSQNEEESHSGESEFSGDSIDGTSPAVIAQVSELLNYVYGKTSVPGQIDRVSTIMRAYEGREAVLLELLETKALIKANKEKENADNLPSFLRNSQAMQFKNSEDAGNSSDMPPVTPMATSSQQHVGSGGTLINDDISSMSGVSSPAEGQQHHHNNHHHLVHGQILNPPHMSHEEEVEVSHIPRVPHQELNRSMDQQDVESPQPTKQAKNRVVSTGSDTKKKKKGIFGGLFGGKKNKKNKDTAGALPANDSLRSGSRSRASRKLKNGKSAEFSI